MKIIRATNESQLKLVCDMYIKYSDDGFLDVDADACYQSIVHHWRKLGYIRLIVVNAKIVGFIMATIQTPKHSKTKCIVQEYFCTNLKGFASARAVRLAHRDLVREAKERRIAIVMSSGSHLDPTFVFTRILERDGWKRQGHIAVLRLVGRHAACPGWAASPPLSTSAENSTEADPVATS